MPKPQYYANPQSYPQQQQQQQYPIQPEYQSQSQPQIYVRPQRRQTRDENSCLACAWLVDGYFWTYIGEYLLLIFFFGNSKQSCSLLLGDVLLAMLMLPVIMHLKFRISLWFQL